jgi:putative nucleotidyltransferase with HDIG domain
MLSKLFVKKKSASNGKDLRPLSAAVKGTILDSLGLKAVPVMPQAAQKAFQLATNPKADAQDFIEVIEADEGLSARIVKIANSVFYDRGGGSKTISDAVQVIGTTELRGLLNASALSDVFSVKHSLRGVFWSHDIATALTARIIAQRVLPSQAEHALLAGLMHDVGKLLMLQRHTDTYEKITRRGAQEGLESIVAEATEYPFDHTEVGQLIAERWNFSEDLTAAIRFHHQDWSDIPHHSLIAVVKASNIVVHSLGLGEGKDGPRIRAVYEPHLAECWSALAINSGDQKGILNEARRTFETEFELYASWGSK